MDKRFAGLLAIIGGQPIRPRGQPIRQHPPAPRAARIVDPKEMFK